MIKAELTLPEIGLIAVTRGLLGAGIALLLADKLSVEQRKAIGWTLVGVGALTLSNQFRAVHRHRVFPVACQRQRKADRLLRWKGVRVCIGRSWIVPEKNNRAGEGY
jgi:hypothetical protein